MMSSAKYTNNHQSWLRVLHMWLLSSASQSSRLKQCMLERRSVLMRVTVDCDVVQDAADDRGMSVKPQPQPVHE